GGLLQPRIDGDRATQAAARSRRSHVAETLVREPYDRRAVVVQRKHALPPSRDDALDDRPAVALASGERTLLEDGGVLHVLRAVLGEKPAAIPEVARAGLHDTGVPHRRRGRVTLGERRRVVGGGNPHIARLGQLQRTRLVEGP